MTRCKKTRLAEEGLGYDIDSLILTEVYCVKVLVANWSFVGLVSKYVGFDGSPDNV